MAGELFTEEQLRQITDAILLNNGQHLHGHPPHPCRFDDAEAKAMHGLADALENGGLENFRMVLEFGSTLRQIRKWGTAAIVTTVIAGLLAALWSGFKASIMSGKVNP
jgi:hypothetical protein